MKTMIKNGLAAIMLAIALASVAFAQTRPGLTAAEKPRVAVVEFTPGPNASVIAPDARRQFQALIASRLMKSHRMHIVDVQHTREASQADLPTVNGASTAAAVRVGKQLQVGYVLTGMLTEYNPKGFATIKTRLVEVSTGKIIHTEELSHQSTIEMRIGNDVEMKTNVLLPIVLKLVDILVEQDLKYTPRL